jgi:RNA polymerase sigma-70 factor (ECF subfamily)
MAELTRSFSSDQAFDQTDRLVIRLRDGDETAFTEAFHLYKDLVYSLACKLLSDKAEAMDVTQEVFLTLFRKIDSFRGDSSLKTWLYRVAVNQAASRNRWWRRRFRNRTTSLSLGLDSESPSSIEVPSSDPSMERACLSGELGKAITHALGNLPFEQRAALTLRDVEGLSYEEISTVAGVSIGTVKSRIARARERLRKALHSFRGSEKL